MRRANNAPGSRHRQEDTRLSIDSKLLNRLKAEQAQYALQALRHPNTRDGFEYGYRCGVFNGLEKAVEVLLTLLDEERNGNSDI